MEKIAYLCTEQTRVVEQSRLFHVQVRFFDFLKYGTERQVVRIESNEGDRLSDGRIGDEASKDLFCRHLCAVSLRFFLVSPFFVSRVN